ncbi:2-oxo acid dehydrogenase subunit E2 [Nannocystis sp. ILAH1]|uniref:2-oxo acid dehydrogenase subunit E2 n=1 Tax=Nannocystis sp. ILAH1 TaxID=2996789 RepID=UPI00226EB500|nr:2-oxo acid dehydrogenase subunit E2 [Nannocystis sp. ILAH1]MCY0989785.1 2-oxo acid dehydrogenase subunit E2 [Nannocystis sp. ILAH1]
MTRRRLCAAPRIHVALAVSLRDGGLVNPASHDAGHSLLPELMAKMRDITQSARTGSLRAITVTNLGDAQAVGGGRTAHCASRPEGRALRRSPLGNGHRRGRP